MPNLLGYGFSYSIFGESLCRLSKSLFLQTYPFLSIAILQVVNTTRVPLGSNKEQIPWHPPVIGHNPEVGKEPRHGLDHADLPISQGNQAFVHQLIMDRVARFALHDVGFGFFISKGNSRDLKKRGMPKEIDLPCPYPSQCREW